MSHTSFKKGLYARKTGKGPVPPLDETHPDKWLKGWNSLDRKGGEVPPQFRKRVEPGSRIGVEQQLAGQDASIPIAAQVEQRSVSSGASPPVPIGNAPGVAGAETQADVNDAAAAAGFPVGANIGASGVGGLCYRCQTKGQPCAGTLHDGKRCTGASHVPLARTVADETAQGILDLVSGATSFFMAVPIDDIKASKAEARGLGAGFHAMSIATGWPGPLSAGLMLALGALTTFSMRAGIAVRKRRSGLSQDYERSFAQYEAYRAEQLMKEQEAKTDGKVATSPPTGVAGQYGNEDLGDDPL